MVDASGTLDLGTLHVHRLGFGTMQLTGPGVWGAPKDHDGAIRVLRAALTLGVDLIDTADSYGPSVAEELVREALHSPHGRTCIPPCTPLGRRRPVRLTAEQMSRTGSGSRRRVVVISCRNSLISCTSAIDQKFRINSVAMLCVLGIPPWGKSR